MGVDLKAKKWPGDVSCSLCGEPETVNHLMFCCPLSHFGWWCIKEALGWDRPPHNFDEFVDVALKNPGAGTNHVGWAILGAFAWATWTTRNDLVFNHKVCSNSLSNLYKTMINLSQWRALLPAKRKGTWDKTLDKLKLETRRLQLMMPKRGVG